MNTKDPQEFWKSIKRIAGKECKQIQPTIRNENGVLLEGEEVLKGFTKRFENTFKIQDADNQLFDRKTK